MAALSCPGSFRAAAVPVRSLVRRAISLWSVRSVRAADQETYAKPAHPLMPKTASAPIRTRELAVVRPLCALIEAPTEFRLSLKQRGTIGPSGAPTWHRQPETAPSPRACIRCPGILAHGGAYPERG